MATFSDFNTSLAIHPDKRDLALKTDVDAVKQSIKNLVLTNKLERPFQPGIGCDIRKMLFENFTSATVAMTKEMIVEVLEAHEPRCNLINVQTTIDEDNNALYITIVFSVINSSNIETVDLVLERVR